MKKTASAAIVFSTLCLLLAAPPLFADQAVVQGQIIARASNLPAPGLTVSLVHPALGRSAPAVTDAYGRFIFYGIPIMPAPYYIEVYWGYQLIYRATVPVHTVTVTLPPLFL